MSEQKEIKEGAKEIAEGFGKIVVGDYPLYVIIPSTKLTNYEYIEYNNHHDYKVKIKVFGGFALILVKHSSECFQCNYN